MGDRSPKDKNKKQVQKDKDDNVRKLEIQKRQEKNNHRPQEESKDNQYKKAS